MISSVSQLKEKGHRISRGRKAILEVFHTTDKPLTAIEILKQLDDQGVQVNKTTVYRELAFLTGEALLREVPVSSNTVYYESALQHHHHHLVCNSCSTIIEVDAAILEKDVEELTRMVRKDNGFTIKEHALEFFGTCISCQSS